MTQYYKINIYSLFFFLFTFSVVANPAPILDFETQVTIKVKDFSDQGMDDFEAIQAAIAALDTGTPTLIEFETRIYTISPPDDFTAPLIWLDRRGDVIIDGKGADFIITSEISLFRANDCKNVIFKNYTLDYDPLPFTQGTIESFDFNTKRVVVKLDAGYRPINDDFKMTSEGGIRTKEGFLIKDPNGSGAQKKDCNNTYNFRSWIYNAGANTYTGYLSNFITGNTAPIQAGDKFVLLAIGNYGNTHELPTTENVTIMNARIYSAYNAVFYVGDSENLGLINNKIYIKPHSNRLCSGVRDGIIGSNTYRGALVDHCVIEANGDDGLNFSPRGAGILEPPSGNTLTIFQQQATNFLTHTYHYRVGDTISIFSFDQKKEIYTGRILTNSDNTPVDVNPDPAVEDLRSNRTFTLAGTGAYLNQNLPLILDVPDGDLEGGNIRYLVFNRSKGANNFVITNSIFRYNRRYGLMLGATSGTVKNTLFEGTAANAISFRYEDTTLISYYADRLQITNNTFKNCFLQALNPRLLKTGIVSIEGPVVEGDPIHKNVSITHNNFINWEGEIPFNLNNIQNLEYYENKFCNVNAGSTTALLGNKITNLNNYENQVSDEGCFYSNRDYDSDGDGVANNSDNCMATFNPAQLDMNEDGTGDVCQGNTDVSLAGSYYLDFGLDDAHNGNTTMYPYYWNNITDGSVGAFYELRNENNTTTGPTVTISQEFYSNGIQNGGLLFPEITHLGSLAQATATEDYFFVTNNTGKLVFKGLSNENTYQCTLFGSRAIETNRISFYKLIGDEVEEGHLQTSGLAIGEENEGGNGNNSEVFRTEKMRPNADGEIILELSAMEGGFGYLNAMRLDSFYASVANLIPVEVGTAVYPNPVKDYFSVKTRNTPACVKVFSLEGRLLLTALNRKHIAVGSLGKGVYLVKIMSENGTAKIVKMIKN